jgi:DNA-directed RNA polymerase specialized sigma24 family protein
MISGRFLFVPNHPRQPDMSQQPESIAYSTQANADHTDDLTLARAIVAGSEESWHAFVHRYSGLILAVARRYLGGRQDDEVRSLYADVLESLRLRKLATYEGRCALSTWIVLVTRSEVIDTLRYERGGRELRAALSGLDPFERQVFRHFYLEGQSLGAVTRIVRDEGARVTPERVLLALRRIEERIQGGLARRLRYDLYAQSVGASSGRLLEYIDHVHSEFEERAATQGADYYLLEREARRTIERVQEQITRLPADEQRLLTLRFEQGWPARRIAEELGWDGQRSVYTVMERILRTIRRALGQDAKPAPRGKGEPAAAGHAPSGFGERETALTIPEGEEPPS